jgi:pilus assembly protein CpaB
MAIRTIERARRRGGVGGLVGLSLLAGSIVVAAGLLRQQPAPVAPAAAPVVAGFDTVLLPVPVEPVPSGTRVSAIRLKRVAYPRHLVPDGAITDTTPLSEGVTTAALPANLPLFRANVSVVALSNPVTEQIPAGMRAMTLRVDATAAVEGWAGSGTFVDVLLIEKERTTVVAEKVKVLSAERSVSPVEGSGAPQVPSTVTVLVTQEQCLAINTAIPRGKIAFALRSTRDEARWNDTVYTAERLKGEPLVTVDDRGLVTGFASIGGGSGARTFALANGRWVKADVVPEGFMVGRDSIGEEG